MGFEPWLQAAVFGLVGLLIGSFLNVVIHRLPRMMEADWAAECEDYLRSQPGSTTTTAPVAKPEAEPFNLVTPRSRCPACGHAVRWHENIPVLSYLWLGGKCSACKTRISPRYPAVELATGLLFWFCARHWGATPTAAAWCAFSAALVTLACIDWDTTLLPDDITLPLLWGGLLGSAFQWTSVPLFASVAGAAAGYLSLWAVYWAFKLATGKGGHGLWRFQAVRGPRRLVRLAGPGAHHPDGVGHRGAGRHRHEVHPGPARGQLHPLRPVPRRRRARRHAVRARPHIERHPGSAGPVTDAAPRPAPLRLGLTGGIGSGKTTVGQWLQEFGAALVDADRIARSATAAGGLAIPAIRSAFGDGMIDADGAMDRARMRELAFRDAGARQRLEAIVHPLVAQAIHAEAERAAADGARVVVFDIPLLAESDRWPPQLDRILVVDCSEATQVARVQARSGLAPDTVQAIIASQAPRAARRAVADMVLHNDRIPLDTLRTEVRRIADGFGL